ncbi:MAG: hypothetical protein JST08_14385 [Actinobacteria bacterium]|nr:hypothetical protein [Actinomycetota bacterium]
MHRLLPKLSYANVVATLALCLALGGGAAFAAGKIGADQIAGGGVHTKNLRQRSVTSGKLALGAVRSNQIAPRAVDSGQLAAGAVGSAQLGREAVGTAQLGREAVGSAQLGREAVGTGQVAREAIGSAQIGKGAVGSAQIGDGAVGPAQMQFPVSLVASPRGGARTVDYPVASYPLTGASWPQRAGSVALLVGTFTAEVSMVSLNECDVQIEFGIGEGFSGGTLGVATVTNLSHSENQVLTGAVPTLPILADAAGTTELTAQVREFGGCVTPSTITSTDLRVIELG